jgi:hypothetical protein
MIYPIQQNPYLMYQSMAFQPQQEPPEDDKQFKGYQYYKKMLNQSGTTVGSASDE